MTLPPARDAPPVARCFLALLPAESGRQVLARGRTALERASVGAATGLRFVDPAALHLTLRFLGDSSPAQVAALARALPSLAQALPPQAGRRLAIWPNRVRPRLLVLELAADASLLALASACAGLAQDAGYRADPRPFRAHVTLARLRPGCAFGTLPQAPPALEFAAISLLQGNGAAGAGSYARLAQVALAAAGTPAVAADPSAAH